MRKWDLLLEWMTHLGSGAWGAFRGAAAELADGRVDVDEPALVRTLRITLSDLGHVDFFVDGTPRWRVPRPALAGLSERGEHLYVGGRTRLLTARLCDAVAPRASLTLSESVPGLSRLHIAGDPQAVAEAAAGVGIEYVADAAANLSARLPSIRAMMEAAQPAQEPINWSVRSWSFQDARWVDERLARTVREYSNRHGVRRYFVDVGKAGLREIEKRASVYCAALCRGLRVVRYSCEDRRLRVPRWAPLPAVYARSACLASGRIGVLSGEEILFENVDPCVASTLLVCLGQGFPMPATRP